MNLKKLRERISRIFRLWGNLMRWPTVIAMIAPVAHAVERLPLEDFAREPEVRSAKMSPDGKHLAFLRSSGGRTMVFFNALDEAKAWSIDPGTAALANGAPKDIESFVWVSNRRLLFTTTVWDSLYGVMAIDLDGKDVAPISGYETISAQSLREPATFVREVLAQCFDREPLVLMIDRHENSAGSTEYPDVVRVNTMTGSIWVVAKNPGNVVSWAADDQGIVRAGFTSDGNLSGMIYRGKEGESWQTVLPLEPQSSYLRPLGYDEKAGKFLIATLTKEKRWAPCYFDPLTKELDEPLLSDAEYDIIPERFIPRVEDRPLSCPVYSPTKGLLGFRYFTESPRVKWFDKDFAGYQRKMDRGLPNSVNIAVDISEDGNRILWFAFSDQDPGTYYLSDLEKHSFKSVAKRMSWIKPAQMASMLSIKYSARDGVVIHGYLTVPVGHQPKNLPLIVVPHGGPWVRDIWEFDTLVQLLANRGYAVLQMNYRGSPGYGEEFFEMSQRQIGGAIQDDIEDATRWAIAAGIADPKRIAIFGGSYGGYSALFGLGSTPELYRCGISFAGVTDWLDIFQRRRHDPDYKRANEYWREQIGDPDKDTDRLWAASPVNFAEKITAPVLIIQGKEDRIVPPQQANLMLSALEKKGRKPERLFLPKVGHYFGGEKSRKIIFKRIVDFLEANLGPGVD